MHFCLNIIKYDFHDLFFLSFYFFLSVCICVSFLCVYFFWNFPSKSKNKNIGEMSTESCPKSGDIIRRALHSSSLNCTRFIFPYFVYYFEYFVDIFHHISICFSLFGLTSVFVRINKYSFFINTKMVCGFLLNIVSFFWVQMGMFLLLL